MGACNSKSSEERRSHLAEDSSHFHDNSCSIAVHQGSVLGLASHRSLIASCSDDKTISLTDRSQLLPNQQENPSKLTGHDKAVNRVHFDSHNGFLYSASRDLSVQLVRSQYFPLINEAVQYKIIVHMYP